MQVIEKTTFNWENEIIESARTSLVDYKHISREDLRTKLVFNDNETKSVLFHIERELSECKSFWFSVAFISDSGLADLKGDFDELARKEKVVKGRLLTSTYNCFNKPEVFEELLKIKNLDVRIVQNGSFHIKGFLFSKEETKTLIVGSSNLTDKGLKTNSEWNIKLSSVNDGEIIKETENVFEEMWNESVKLTKTWIKKYRSEYNKKHYIENRHDIRDLKQKVEENEPIDPNSMQEETLKKLSKTRKEMNDKALIVSATGTGKTFLSALDVKNYNPGKMLFLVHREQILDQAKKSFERVLGKNINTGKLTGNEKDDMADYLFSTVQIMAKKKYREKFKAEEFDYIIIDETHKAGASSYEKILDYFKPKFLLGMTATPERTDGKNIFQIFDNNVVQEIRLKDAMEADLLCPFHYYGISEVEVEGKVISSEAQFKNLTSEERVNNIIEKAEYYGYSGDRVKGLVFCSRKKEAEMLSKSFNKKGYNTTFLTGKHKPIEREEAVRKLEKDGREGSLDYIFTVDVFNEGVDIPEVNQIIMLRETQSSIIFVQQLGRGLRKTNKKDYVVVLDFIGNYKNNYMIPAALSGDNSYDKDRLRKYTVEANNVIPGRSTVYFDKVAREKIYKAIAEISDIKKILRKQYKILKMKLGRIPRLIDFYEKDEMDPLKIIEEYKSYNKFLKTVEKKEYKVNFTENQERTLVYFSENIMKGIRPSELIMLYDEINGKKVTYDSVRKKCVDYNYSLGKETFEHSKELLRGKYASNSNEEKENAVVETEISKLYSRMSGYIHHDEIVEFKKQLEDIIKVGLKRYMDKYYNKNDNNTEDHRFVINEQYSRSDVCLLTNAEKSKVSTMYGQFNYNDESFIFVTYNKKTDENNNYIEGKPDYDDGFVNSTYFNWDSKIGYGVSSKYVKKLINAKKRHLFVQKNDEEQFYYLGLFTINEDETREGTKINNQGKKQPITKMQFIMNAPVSEDLINYFESE